MTVSYEVTRACRDCTFWGETPGHVLGECHARPPVVVHQPNYQAPIVDDFQEPPGNKTVWPLTTGADWCGVFQFAERDTTEEPCLHVGYSFEEHGRFSCCGHRGTLLVDPGD